MNEDPPLDPDAAQARKAAQERVPTEQSSLVTGWIVFGSLVVCVLSCGALIGALFP